MMRPTAPDHVDKADTKALSERQAEILTPVDSRSPSPGHTQPGAVFNGRPMMMAFDVDCGELIPGHHFIARGLGGPFRLPIPDDRDGDSAQYEQMLEFAEAGR
jgi:hypothetical protein